MWVVGKGQGRHSSEEAYREVRDCGGWDGWSMGLGSVSKCYIYNILTDTVTGRKK